MIRNQKNRTTAARPWPVRLAFAAALLAGLLALSLLGAACGGSGPGVAQVPTSGTSTNPSGSSNSSSKGNPTKYAACMRKHGVPNFPDPDSQGHFRLEFGRSRNGQTTGIDPNSPEFRKAQQACRKLAPNGGKPNPQEEAKMLQQALRYSACMRSHGVPNFPDPKQGPEGGTLMTIGKGINPNSPQFQAAQKACQKLVPGSSFSEGPDKSP